jgi:hypothetical protein
MSQSSNSEHGTAAMTVALLTTFLATVVFTLGILYLLSDETGQETRSGIQPSSIRDGGLAPSSNNLTPVQVSAISAQDRAGIEAAVRGFFSSYSQGNMVSALAFVSATAAQQCGGATRHALAYAQLARTERTTYEFVSAIVRDDASVDVVLDIYLSGGDKSDRTRITLGFSFVLEIRWVFSGDPLKQVSVFCR